jgi:hypothetical protein
MALQPKIPYGPGSNNIKCVQTIQTPRRQLTEIHYSSLVGTANLPGALVNGVVLSNARFSLLGNQCTILKTEVNCVLSPRWTASDTHNAFNLPSAPAFNINDENDSIRMFCRGTSLYRKSFFLGGVPDVVMNDDLYQFAAAGNFNTNLLAYENILTGPSQWGWMPVCEDPTAAPRVKIRSIQNTIGAPNVVTVVCFAAHGIPGTGLEVVRISRVTGANPQAPVNQLWNVTVVSANTFVLNNWPVVTPTVFSLVGSGFAQNTFRIFQRYTEVDYELNMTTRERGVRGITQRATRKVKRTLGY